MMNNQPYKAVVFDVFGTLIEIKTANLLIKNDEVA